MEEFIQVAKSKLLTLNNHKFEFEALLGSKTLNGYCKYKFL